MASPCLCPSVYEQQMWIGIICELWKEEGLGPNPLGASPGSNHTKLGWRRMFIHMRTEGPWHDSKDRTVATGELGTRVLAQDGWDRTAGKWQIGRSVDHRIARENSRHNTARAGNRGHEGQNMISRTGQRGRYTSVAGQLWKDSRTRVRDRTAKKIQSGQVGRTGHQKDKRRQNGQDMTARTEQPDSVWEMSIFKKIPDSRKFACNISKKEHFCTHFHKQI
jgi:hypothetical protein